MRNAEFDPCLRFINGELPCVAEQILEHHPEQARIAVADDAFSDDAFDAALRRGGPELLQDNPRHRTEVHDLLAHLAARDPRQIQKVVDQRRHVAGGGPDPIEESLRFHVELAGIILDQRQAETVDAAQRCAQVVRDRMGKCLKLLVGGLELRRVPPLRFVQQPHFFRRPPALGDVADYPANDDAVGGLDPAAANLDREFGAILATPWRFRSLSVEAVLGSAAAPFRRRG